MISEDVLIRWPTARDTLSFDINTDGYVINDKVNIQLLLK